MRSLPLAALPADGGLDCKLVDAAGCFEVVGFMDSEDRSKICCCAIGVPKCATYVNGVFSYVCPMPHVCAPFTTSTPQETARLIHFSLLTV